MTSIIQIVLQALLALSEVILNLVKAAKANDFIEPPTEAYPELESKTIGLVSPRLPHENAQKKKGSCEVRKKDLAAYEPKTSFSYSVISGIPQIHAAFRLDDVSFEGDGEGLIGVAVSAKLPKGITAAEIKDIEIDDSAGGFGDPKNLIKDWSIVEKEDHVVLVITILRNDCLAQGVTGHVDICKVTVSFESSASSIITGLISTDEKEIEGGDGVVMIGDI